MTWKRRGRQEEMSHWGKGRREGDGPSWDVESKGLPESVAASLSVPASCCEIPSLGESA